MDTEDIRADAQTAIEARNSELQLAREYATPIVFYGLVLDERDQPVSQAEVEFMNGDTPDGNWTWKKTLADSNGAFVLQGIRGRRLDIKIRKSGYYTISDSRRNFTYAGYHPGKALFIPDPDNPVVFRLRKNGEAAELIHRSDQVLFNLDETERSFSFYDHSRRRDQSDYVIIRPVDRGRINSRGKHVLDLELSTPKGGIQLRTDKFQFVAPTNGYQTSLIAPPNVGTDLVDFFVRFENGNYGRFTIAGNSGQYDVDSYLNPDKSPNLEYDPEKEITFVQTGKMGIDLLYPAKKEAPKKQ